MRWHEQGMRRQLEFNRREVMQMGENNPNFTQREAVSWPDVSGMLPWGCDR